MKDFLTIILAAAAIATVYFVIFSDPWFIDTLIGRAIAITALSVMCFSCFIAGVVHRIDGVSDD
jgi:hypothetical protein